MTPKITWDAPQRAAVEWSGREILVSAGAGTGKTSVLVGRVLHKLREERVPLDALLVVTFTEKAAREMRARIHEALAGDAALRHLLPNLPRAAISTIDAFCKRLLAENFLEAGVEPGFRVLDPRGQEEGLGEALRRAFHEAYTAGSNDDQLRFARLVDMGGYAEGREMLRDVVRRLYEQARVSPDWSRYLEALEDPDEPRSVGEIPWYPGYLAMLEERWAQAVQIYRDAITLASAELGEGKLKRHIEWVQGIEALPPPPSVTPERAPNGAGKIEGWKRRADSAKKGFAEVAAAWPRDPEQVLAEERAGRRDVALLAKVVRAVDRHYTDWKKRQGVLDFADLEIRALQLLRDHGEALGLQDRYEEVLVDEFQDVNRLQAAILERVSRPGRRFRVGDVKQSIYQFRLAEPSIFRGLTEGSAAVDAQGAPPPGAGPLALFLKRNHRSRPAILAWVNHLFARLFDAGTIGSDYGRQALEPAITEPGRPVELHCVVGGSSADEARLVAGMIPELLRDEGRSRRDVAILLRSRTRAEDFLEALRAAHIPARIREGGSLFEEPLVRDLRMLLSVIDNPRDDVALAATLRSPLVRLRDEDLARIRLARPTARSFLDAVLGAAGAACPALAVFLPMAPGEDPDAALAAWAGPEAGAPVPERVKRTLRRFLERIAAWREEEQRLDLERFLSEVTKVAGFHAALAVQPDAATQRAYLDRFLALAAEYQAERGPSLRGFLARVETIAEGRGAAALTGSAGEDDAVEILTIHAAKGLEWPIVIVPCLGWRFQDDRKLGGTIRIGPEGVGLRAFDGQTWTRRETCLRRMLKHTARQATNREEARVLYVAMTRAEERLVLVGSRKKSSSENRVELLGDRTTSGASALEWVLDAQSTTTLEVVEHAAADVASPAPPPAPQHEPLAAIDRVIERINVPLAARALAGLRGKYWVTEFKRPDDEARFRELEETEAASLLVPAVEAARRGTQYHAALARIDLGTPPLPQFDLFASEPWWEGEREPRLEEGFARFLETPLGERLIAAAARGEVEREAPFSLKWPLRRLAALSEELPPLPAELLDAHWVLLQGRLDCVFRDGARHVVIDWKTDRLAAIDTLARADVYRSQMELYGEAVSALWGGDVECWLVFVGAGGLCLRVAPSSGSPGRSSPLES